MNKLINNDCIIEMTQMGNNSVDCTLTDIPYDVVNRNMIFETKEEAIECANRMIESLEID